MSCRVAYYIIQVTRAALQAQTSFKLPSMVSDMMSFGFAAAADDVFAPELLQLYEYVNHHPFYIFCPAAILSCDSLVLHC
jgi:hypothetical protein